MRRCQAADCSGEPKDNAGGAPAYFQLTATGKYGERDELPQISAEAITVYQGDDEGPSVGDVTVEPNGWVNDSGTVAVRAAAADDGLGVADLTLRVPRGDGSDEVIRESSTAEPCGAPRAAQCLASFSARLTFAAAGHPEGTQQGVIEARDRTLKTASAAFSYKLDRTAPTIGKATIDGSRKWVGDGKLSVTAQAADGADRSGVRVLRLRQGDKEIAASDPACDAAGECPETLAHTFAVDHTALNEGAQSFEVVAEDSAGNRSEPRSLGEIRVDHGAPRVTSSGSLVDARGKELSGGAYTLQVDADDGSSRSGVREIEFLVDGKHVRTHDVRGCTSQRCPATASARFTFRPAKEGTGKHTVEVRTTDLAGNTETTRVDAGVAAVRTLSQESLGFEDWLTYDSMDTGAGTRAAVNLTSGNLLWTKTPVSIRGRGLSTFVRLTYNAMEPTSTNANYYMAGRGVSVQASGLTRLNEPLDVSNASTQIVLADGDGTRHTFLRTLDGSRERYESPAGVHLWLRRFTNPANPDSGDDPKRWAITRADGVTYFFDKDGFQRSIVDRNGNALTFHYVSVAPPAFGPTTCGHSPSGCGRRVDYIADPEGRHLDIAYGVQSFDASPTQDGDFEGAITSITDHSGRVTRFKYRLQSGFPSTPVLSTVTEAAGTSAERVTRLEWDGLDSFSADTPQLRKIHDPRSRWTLATYDGTGVTARVQQLDDRRRTNGGGTRGNRRIYGYAASGQNTVTTVSEPFANDLVTSGTRATSYTTDGRGRLTRLVDARATVTTQTWDNDPGGTGQDNNNPVREVVNAEDPADGTPGGDPRSRARAAVTDWRYNDTEEDHGASMSEVTDPNGHKTTFAYQRGSGTQVATGTSGGQSNDANRKFVVDLHKVTTPRGNESGANPADFTTTFDRDERGNVRFRTVAGRQPFETQYAANGNVTLERDEVGNQTSYGCFDPQGQARKRTDPRGKVWLTQYDAVGRVSKVTDPRGVVNAADCLTITNAGSNGGGGRYTATYTYDALDRKLSEQMPKESAKSPAVFVNRAWTHDSNDNVHTRTDGAGNVWVTEYSETDQPAEEREPSTSPPVGQRITRYEYDDFDNVAVKRMPADNNGSHATRYVYDTTDNRILEDRTTGPSAFGANDLLTGMAYDRRGNLVGVSDPKHNVSTQPAAAIANASTPAGQRWRFEYDKADNRTAKVEDPDDLRLRTTFEYDANDQLAAQVDPRAFDTDFDGKGNVDGSGAFVTPLSGFRTRYQYDNRDLLTDVFDQLDRHTKHVLRDDGKVTDVISPKGTATADPGDYTTHVEYWPTGEVKSRSIPYDVNQYAVVRTWKVQYDLNEVGDPTLVTDARGHTFANTFYDTGELKTTGRPSWWIMDATSIRERTQEDPKQGSLGAIKLPDAIGGSGDLGDVDQMELPEAMPRKGRAHIGYDGEMRVTEITNVEGLDATQEPTSDARYKQKFAYDPAGRQIEHSYPFKDDSGSRIAVGTGYDLNGNVAKTVQGSAGFAPGEPHGPATSYTHDNFDRLKTVNAPGADDGSRNTTYDYDANGNVTVIRTARAGFNRVLGYDEVDRRLLEREPQTGSDPKTERQYRYDANGNRTRFIAPRGLDYEAPTAEQMERYTTRHAYDGADQLTRVTFPSTSDSVTNADRTVAYDYDANGNETERLSPGAAPNEGQDIRPQRRVRRWDGRDLLWTETVGTAETATTTVTEYDGNANLRRTVNPKGVGASGLPQIDSDPNGTVTTGSDSTRNATVREYDEDGLLMSLNLPRASDTDGRWRQEYDYTSRGFINDVFTIFDWNGSNHSPYSQHYGAFHNGWPSSSSEDLGPSYSQQIEYDYDDRGNQTLWRSAGGTRQIKRAYWPSDELKHREASRHEFSANGPLLDFRSYDYSHNLNGSLTRIVDRQPPEASTACRRPDAAASCPKRTTSVSRDGGERPRTINEQWATGKDTRYRYLPGGIVDQVAVDGRVQEDGSYLGGAVHDHAWDERENNTKTDVSYGSSSHATAMRYWPSGALFATTTPAARVESRYYATDGRITHKRIGKDSITSYSWQYDGNRNRNAETRAGVGDPQTTTWSYNARDQLVEWKRPGLGQRASHEVDYTLDGDGQIRTKVETFGATSDTAAATVTTTSAYTGDRLDSSQSTQSGFPPKSTDFDYDVFGSQTKMQTSDGSGPDDLTRYKYDPFERQTRTWSNDTSDNPDGKDNAFCYDGLDRRDRRIRLSHDLGAFDVGSGGAIDAEQNPCSASFNNATGFDYSYLGLTEGLTREVRPQGSSSDINRYEYDGASRKLGRGKQPNSTTTPSYRSYEWDAYGSVIGLESPSTGVAEGGDRYDFDPYGELEVKDSSNTRAETELSADAKENPLRYQGFYYDSTTRTYDMQARSYRPGIQRFLTQDRFEGAGADLALHANPLTNNSYAFTAGNPVERVEYDGHIPGAGNCVNTRCGDNAGNQMSPSGRNPNVSRPANAPSTAPKTLDNPAARTSYVQAVRQILRPAPRQVNRTSTSGNAAGRAVGDFVGGVGDATGDALSGIASIPESLRSLPATVWRNKGKVAACIALLPRCSEAVAAYVVFDTGRSIQEAYKKGGIARALGVTAAIAATVGATAAVTRVARAVRALRANPTSAAKELPEGVGAMRRLEYDGASYHGRFDRGLKSRAPTNGQGALDHSLQVGPNSPRRVGIDYDAGDFVVFDRTTEGVFHGHVRPWNELTPQMQNTLRRSGMADRRGRILVGSP